MNPALTHVRIVLVNTSHPGNIGAAARAMKTMGLDELVLVAPRRYPADEAIWRAAGAADLLAAATVVDDLAEAISDCSFVIGTSARERRISWPLVDAREAARRALVAATAGARVAVVFGREDRGLTNDELQRCQLHLTIPTADDYSALNLGAAVQVVCYELRQAALADEPPPPELRDVDFATAAELQGLFEHIERALLALEFYDPENPKQLLTRLRRLLARVPLDQMEVSILRGILTAVEKAAK